jgi:hypothetical protein
VQAGTWGTAGAEPQRWPKEKSQRAIQQRLFYLAKLPSLDCQRFYALVQAALVASSLVLRHDAFVDHTIDDGNSIFKGRCRSVLVTGINCLNDVFNLGAHARTQAHVVLASLLRLLRALSR